MAKEKTEPKKEEISTNEAVDAFLETNKDDHFNFIVPENKVVSTGSLILDSLVKIRTGGVVRLVGKGAELGKTSEALVLADNYMKVMPKSKTLFVKAESRLSHELMVRSGMKFVTEPKEWGYGTVFIFSCNHFETVADFIEKFLPLMFARGEHLCIIIDSLDGLILKEDVTKAVWGEASPKVAGVPLLTKLFFRRCGLPIQHYDALAIITGQYSVAIKIDPKAKPIPRQVESSGGSNLIHQSDYVFSYSLRYSGDYIMENEDDSKERDPTKNKILGVWSSIEIIKSGTDESGTKVRIPIKKGRIGCAIWTEKEIVDTMIIFQLLLRKTAKGAWYEVSPKILTEAKEAGIDIPEKFQGLPSVYEYVETDKKAFAWLHGKIKTAIGA